MDASIVVVLQSGREPALRCLGALAELPQRPSFDVVVVDNASVGLDDVLGCLDGDVQVVRLPRRVSAAAALAAGAERCSGEHVVLLRGAVAVGPDWLAPLLRVLSEPGVACATSVTDGQASPAAALALACRRADLSAAGGPAAAPDGLELAATALALARAGDVRPVPESVVQPPTARLVGARGAFGAEPELSIVIPTLDATSDRVRDCVRAIQAATEVAHEVILIDNGAPPQGFTAPVNAGLRAARGSYLVVMNDDVEVQPGWWAPQRERLDAGAAVTFPFTEDGPMREDFAAWCFAMTRATLEQHRVEDGEFFDPRLRVWYQDTDLLQRLRLAGNPPVCVPEARIRHVGSETVASEDPALRAWVVEQVRADQAAFHAKHGADVAGAARIAS